MRGNVAHAGQLLSQAEAFWASAPTRYAEERIEGLGLRARERRAAGDLDGAITTMRAAITQRLALSGRDNRELAVLYNSFGIILTAAHRLDEALDAYRETLAIYRALGLGDELDSWIVLGNMGGIEVRTGYLKEAEKTLAGCDPTSAGAGGGFRGRGRASGLLRPGPVADRSPDAGGGDVERGHRAGRREDGTVESVDRAGPAVSGRSAARGGGPRRRARHAGG